MTLCGEPKPSSGSIWFEGEQIDSLTTARIMRKDIAVVPEGRRIFARLTVQENLLMGAFFVDKAEQPALLDQVFTMFPRLHERLEQRAGTMSGGEQQMLAIGRALMSKPQLLLLDEPVAGMTDAETEFTAELFRGLAGKHSLMVVEHDMGFVGSIADHVTVLHQGSVLAQGTMDQVQNDQRVIEVYLGE